MLDAIQQNPLIALFLILIPVVATVWKVLDVLYVKPRDFRITVLEKHVEELRGALLNRTPELPPRQIKDAVSVVSVSDLPSAPAATAVPADPLRSLEECHRAWKAEGQTELQRKHFEERYKGQTVSWEVFIDSIDKSKYFISLYADTPHNDYGDYRVCAHFPPTDELRLLEFRKGERVRLSGTIKDFFLFPVLEPAKIEKV